MTHKTLKANIHTCVFRTSQSQNNVMLKDGKLMLHKPTKAIGQILTQIKVA